MEAHPAGRILFVDIFNLKSMIIIIALYKMILRGAQCSITVKRKNLKIERRAAALQYYYFIFITNYLIFICISSYFSSTYIVNMATLFVIFKFLKIFLNKKYFLFTLNH